MKHLPNTKNKEKSPQTLGDLLKKRERAIPPSVAVSLSFFLLLSHAVLFYPIDVAVLLVGFSFPLAFSLYHFFQRDTPSIEHIFAEKAVEFGCPMATQYSSSLRGYCTYVYVSRHALLALLPLSPESQPPPLPPSLLQGKFCRRFLVECVPEKEQVGKSIPFYESLPKCEKTPFFCFFHLFIP